MTNWRLVCGFNPAAAEKSKRVGDSTLRCACSVLGIAMSGWVKLYRKWLESPLAQDANANLVFMHLLVNARREPKIDKRYGYTVGVGEWDVTLKQLAETTGITVKAARGAVDRLVKYETIEKGHTARHTTGILRLCNYAAYQSGDVGQGHAEGHSEGTPRAHQGHSHKNDKKVENGEKKNTPALFSAEKKLPFEPWYQKYPRKVKKPTALKAWDKLTTEQQQLAMGCVDAYRISRLHDIQHTPHPASYLNAHQFNDGIEGDGGKKVGHVGATVSNSEEDFLREAEEHAAKVIRARELEQSERESKGSLGL